MQLILLVLSIAPVVFFAYMIYKGDYDKEPGPMLLKLFISGIGSAFLTLFLTKVLNTVAPFFGYSPLELSLAQLIIYVFVGIALIEEFSKWIFVYKLQYNNREYNHLYDGIVYAAFVSLGFACFENILYVLQGGQLGLNEGVRIAVVRALLAIPGHLCDGIMMGYFLSMAKQASVNKNKEKENSYIALSLVVPVITHGIYDYLLFANDASQNELFKIIFFGFVIFFFTLSFDKINELSSNTKNLNPNYIKENERNKLNQISPSNEYNNNGYIQNNYNNIGFGYPTTEVPENYQNIPPINEVREVSNSQDTIIKCPNCGVEKKGKFCINCGKEFK